MATRHLVSLSDRQGADGTKSDATNAGRDRYLGAPFADDLLKVIALIMVEDGHVTEDEIRLARRIYENMTHESLSRDDLGRMCAFVQQQRLSTQSFLATARDRRSLEEKLMLVQALFGVAGADGQVSPRRLAALIKAQQILDLDEGEFQRAVAASDQWLV
ncbi:MAG: TerB family tellurite resistance protein [Aureliella sp.]